MWVKQEKHGFQFVTTVCTKVRHVYNPGVKRDKKRGWQLVTT